MPNKADWKKSARKFLKYVALFAIGFQVTPDQVAGLLPGNLGSITLSALIVAGLNYAKHAWGDKIPFLKAV